MRFLHAADLHLDSPLRAVSLRDPELGARLALASRAVLSRIVDLALRERVDALLLAGDVFDDAQPDLAARTHLSAQLARLARGGVQTVMIRGNHDALMDHARHGPLGDDVHLLHAERPTVEIAGVAIHGLSHDAPHSRVSALPRYPQPIPGRRNVGLMHSSLDGAAGHDPYAPCAAADLLSHGYDYWALGHIHAREERRGEGTTVVMPGIPQGRHAREAGVGSVTLVTLGDGVRTERRDVALLAFEAVTVDLQGLTDAQSRTLALTDALRGAARDGHEVALRITLTGDGATALAEDPAGILGALAADVEGVHVESARVAAVEAPADNPLADDLSRLMAEEAAKSGFRAEAAAMLATLRAALPPEARDAVPDDALDALLAEGMAALGARVGG